MLLKRDLETALKLSTIFSDKFNKVRLSLNPKEGSLEISSNNTAVGESKTQISAKASGEAISMQFNQRYITDVLGSLRGESVEILLAPGKPMIMRAPQAASFRYLVMPIAQG